MAVQTQQALTDEQLAPTWHYQVSFEDRQNALDFQAECASMGYTPDELFKKVVTDVVNAKRRRDVEKAVPQPNLIDAAAVTVDIN